MEGRGKADVTARDVALYHSSPYAIFCEHFVAETEKDPMSPYRELLLQRGMEHEHQVIGQRYPECHMIAYPSADEGFRALLVGMARGDEALCGLPMFYRPENLQGRMDVIEKCRNHGSLFGDYHYRVVEIKLAKNITREHIIQGAFYTYLLARIQDYLPETFVILNRDCETQEYRFSEYADLLREAVDGTRAILEGAEIPTPTYNGCAWPWERYCNHQALRTRDVSLIGQVGPRTKRNLTAWGFKKIWDVSSAGARALQRVPGIGEATAVRLIMSARAIKEGSPLLLDRDALQFPERSTELFLDLEGTDERGDEVELLQVDYLIGALIRRDGVEEYRPFFARSPRDEGAMFREFMRFIRSQYDYVIYHWHHYERIHIRKLGERYGLSEEVEEFILPHLIDLHKLATNAYAFPTYTNGLKDVAAFLKFRWRHDDINALDAIVYYLRYQEDPEGYRAKVDAIIDYNEDDCIATRMIKDWLDQQARGLQVQESHNAGSVLR
jgi:uncharacterized protein